MQMTKHLGALASVAVMMTVAACGSTGKNVSGSADAALQQQLSASQAKYSAQSQRLAQTEAELAAAQANSNAGNHGAGDLLPPGAQPGQCFTRVWLPPQYKTVSEKRLVQEAGERLEVIPAKYGQVTKKVLVEEASTKIVTVPATYKTVTERVLVRPARTVSEQIAPVYETVSERILDKPAHTTWKKGTGPIQKIDASTGEIMCLVEIPATYKTISKQVLKTPASTRSREIPAEYRTVQKRVVDRQATTKTIQIPAKYSTVTVTEEVTPGSSRSIAIPAKYTTVTRQELVSDGRMDWREILCETNATPTHISAIQRALHAEGFNPGAVDGRVGPGTLSAVSAYQRANNLPVGELNMATIKALGVKF